MRDLNKAQKHLKMIARLRSKAGLASDWLQHVLDEIDENGVAVYDEEKDKADLEAKSIAGLPEGAVLFNEEETISQVGSSMTFTMEADDEPNQEVPNRTADETGMPAVN